ncbi:MAG: hypothetical protein ACR2OE_13900 [Thermomicrobiales bacterium]
MRGKMLVPVAAILLVLTIVITTTSGGAKDTYDQRISNLETRVAALETEVAMPDHGSQSNQQTNVTNSSSHSSVSSSNQGNTSSFSASFSANGEKELPFEIKNAGTYQLTVHASSNFSAEMKTDGGAVIPGFSLASDKEDTLTRSAHLEPGTYTLHIQTSSTWNAVIVLTGS